MSMCWKTILLALWLLSQALGFALPALSSVAERRLPPSQVLEQCQVVNAKVVYDDRCLSCMVYDAEFPPATTHSMGDPVGTPSTICAYDPCTITIIQVAGVLRAPPVTEVGFLAAKGPLRVDPADLRLPPTRAEGADPFKLADQIKKYGTSTEGMPPIQVTRGANGEMMINDGVTRATRGAMTPGTTVPVQVIEENPALNLGNLPKVGERTPGRP